MSHLPRLFFVIRVIAKYRLEEFLAGQSRQAWLRLFISALRFPRRARDVSQLTRFQRLRLAMEELGPIYIKFGQLLSTRRDFLANELADELQSLQDNVPPFETPSVETLIEAALECPVDSVFQHLDPKPLASASIAQVHGAVLHNGDEVVVKVLRPNVEAIVREDIKLLKWLARIIENRTSIGRRLRPVEVVNDYEKIILDELNLQTEGANATQLRRNFEDSPVLYVPKVYWDFTRRNVLVSERIHGIPVTDIDSLESHAIDLKKLAEIGVNIFFTQVFEHNFFHADMHPGNIFVSRSNPHNPQYIAIDCAIIGSLSDADQEYLAKNLLAIFKRDYRRVAELHVECGWVPRRTRVSEFESAMRTVCEPIFEKPLKEISFAHLLVQLFRTAGRFDMEVQPSLVLLQKTLLNVEGLGRQLYPDLDLWQTALPFLEEWNRKRLSPLTLLGKIRAEMPDWVDQLPQLPQLFFNAMEQAGQLRAINETLLEQQRRSEQRSLQQASRARLGGLGALAIALIAGWWSWNEGTEATALASLGFALFGLLLLSFRA